MIIRQHENNPYTFTIILEEAEDCGGCDEQTAFDKIDVSEDPETKLYQIIVEGIRSLLF